MSDRERRLAQRLHWLRHLLTACLLSGGIQTFSGMAQVKQQREYVTTILEAMYARG
jgi:hypothetical protein